MHTDLINDKLLKRHGRTRAGHAMARVRTDFDGRWYVLIIDVRDKYDRLPVRSVRVAYSEEAESVAVAVQAYYYAITFHGFADALEKEVSK